MPRYQSQPITVEEAEVAYRDLGLSDEEIAEEISTHREAAGLITSIAALRAAKRVKDKAGGILDSGGTVDDLKGELAATSSLWSRWYSEVALRMNAIGSLLASRARALIYVTAEYGTLSGVSDDRQTDFCRSYDGYTALLTSWPSWLYPQFHFRCRTLFRKLTTRQVKKGGYRTDRPLPTDEEGGVLRPEETFGGGQPGLVNELKTHLSRARSELAA
jgi:hypothetical protein